MSLTNPGAVRRVFRILVAIGFCREGDNRAWDAIHGWGIYLVPLLEVSDASSTRQ